VVLVAGVLSGLLEETINRTHFDQIHLI
jgi:hypothetical protein